MSKKADEIAELKKQYSVLKCMGARILARKMPEEMQTRSGLFLPARSTRPSIVAQVVGVGEKPEPGVEVEVGDYVLIRFGSGCEIGVGEEPILVIEKSEIMASINPDDYTDKRVAKIISH